MSDDYETHELELAFQAGAASRDAEIAELKTVPMKYRRMAFNAQLQAEVAELAKERDQFRAQLVRLQGALRPTYSLSPEGREELARIAEALKGGY